MKVPMSWLKEYTEFDLPISEFVDRMIMHGLGVEGVEELFEEQKKGQEKNDNNKDVK